MSETTKSAEPRPLSWWVAGDT
ncbi:MAG: hypothetical protein QOC74_3419, partial [Pseudonocardiales bacterium]|nr:hypothetical protein [Pseudonocardiales bacterium]